MDQPISLDAVIEFLVSTPFFDGLDPFERAEVVRIMEVLRLQEGEEIFREGTSGDSWYVIFEGEVRVLKDADTQAQTEIARLGPGGALARWPFSMGCRARQACARLGH
jgi:CRP/FNR family cyclic AMP-dependent transcriptional regulator